MCKDLKCRNPFPDLSLFYYTQSFPFYDVAVVFYSLHFDSALFFPFWLFSFFYFAICLTLFHSLIHSLLCSRTHRQQAVSFFTFLLLPSRVIISFYWDIVVVCLFCSVYAECFHNCKSKWSLKIAPKQTDFTCTRLTIQIFKCHDDNDTAFHCNV